MIKLLWRGCRNSVPKCDTVLWCKMKMFSVWSYQSRCNYLYQHKSQGREIACCNLLLWHWLQCLSHFLPRSITHPELRPRLALISSTSGLWNTNTMLVLTLLVHSVAQHFDWTAAFDFGFPLQNSLPHLWSPQWRRESLKNALSAWTLIPPACVPNSESPETPPSCIHTCTQTKATGTPSPFAEYQWREGGGGPTAAAPQLAANAFGQSDFSLCR